jgi:Heparinase II/III-like protein/Heparinase II/III N-terminus
VSGSSIHPAGKTPYGSLGRLGWYARRLGRMSPAEMAWRAHDQACQLGWAGRQVRPGQPPGAPVQATGHRFVAVLPPGTAAQVPEDVTKAVLVAADQLMAGRWEVLGVTRTDLVQPDWFLDPVSGRRAPAERYAFRIDHRDERQTGNVKQVWELSRLQHLTLLAMAWYLSRDDRYAGRVASQLRSWWQENPFLSGVHWTSGIEIGIRLISMTWIRRLLDGWPGAANLFERNDLAVRQIGWHQQYLDTFRSRGSSANNHVIAEAAGQLVASCAFPWFGRSDRWRRASARLLERELIRNTFPSGIGRELASDYHCFVAELGLAAAIEADAAGCPLSPDLWQRLSAMVDSAAALLDERLRPPRQGDSDEGRALLFDAPAPNRWPGLLALGGAVFGRLGWWPPAPPDAASTVLGALASRRDGAVASRDGSMASHQEDALASLADGAGASRWADEVDRPDQRPSRFADAGTTLLRSTDRQEPEIWCRCDGGPHGYLSIAAHAHADALSVEVRYGGVEILADPGTYCYHGDPAWRSYFRSTIAHNTAEIGGRSQSGDGGPFLWLQHARAREVDGADSGRITSWTAEHDGYLSLRPPVRHRRTVRLDREARAITIIDAIGGGHDVRLAFHFGPEVEAELDGSTVRLRWPGDDTPTEARMQLPSQLRWSLHRGETDPILGWYSPGLGQRVPTFTALGQGTQLPGAVLTTRLDFLSADKMVTATFGRPAISWCASDPAVGQARSRQAEDG